MGVEKVVRKMNTPEGVFDREVYEKIADGSTSYTDSCCVCGRDTLVDIRTPLSQRYNYVAGCGQTCGCI